MEAPEYNARGGIRKEPAAISQRGKQGREGGGQAGDGRDGCVTSPFMMCGHRTGERGGRRARETPFAVIIFQIQ